MSNVVINTFFPYKSFHENTAIYHKKKEMKGKRKKLKNFREKLFYFITNL